MKLFLHTFLLLSSLYLQAQTEIITDTIKDQMLDEVTIRSYRQHLKVLGLPDVHKTFLVAGKKNEVIQVSDLPLNLAEKTGRQLFAKIPGAFIYDMDGSGNQVNVSTRGLDPHRGWEFNVRQNGIITNSDMYGYPASHYNVPMEAIDRVELVRGTASLQYGAQFGGMINYVTKKAPKDKNFSFESINTTGSFGLMASYNAIGGTIGKFSYYAFHHVRNSDGYRDQSRSVSDAQQLSLNYAFSDKLNLTFDLSRSYYRFQLPGPLTDSMFRADPRQNTRSRSFYSPEILIPSISLDWKISENTQLNWVVSGIFGTRSSILFEGLANRPDTIQASTLRYLPRVIDIDKFNSKTSELRLLHRYRTGPFKHYLVTGFRWFDNDMSRRQQAPGSTGTDYDLKPTGPFRRDLMYRSNTLAFFAENTIFLTSAFSISPGLRYEFGQSKLTGQIVYLEDQNVPNKIRHNLPAFGISGQYVLSQGIKLYGGISQAHRPVILKDIIPASVLERADQDLKNATGYVSELGLNARVADWLRADLSTFLIRYNDRLGNLFIRENDSVAYTFKTNIGDSRTRGIELYLEITPLYNSKSLFSLYSSTSLMKGEYLNANVRVSSSENRNIDRNELESVPRWISRNGAQFAYKNLNCTLQYSYVSETYADALNTKVPSPDGSIGLVPAYGIWDLYGSLRFGTRYMIRAGVNNLSDESYFTKRPLFYPGPGIWPSDGRSFYLSFGAKF